MSTVSDFPVAAGSPDLIGLRFADLADLLDGLPAAYTPEVSAANLRLVARLGEPTVISGLLRDLLADPVALAEVGDRSYPHTNHFDKIVLVDTDRSARYRLTMHLWDPPYSTAEAEDEQIHDHRFSFWSAVLVGTLRSQNFLRDPAGEEIREYRYVPEKRHVSTVGNFYTDAGPARLLEVAPSVHHGGTAYHLFQATIHRVVLPEVETTCTLVLRGPRQQEYASVFSNSRKYDPSGNTMFGATGIGTRLDRVLDVLGR